jgi:hypothetical protein
VLVFGRVKPDGPKAVIVLIPVIDVTSSLVLVAFFEGSLCKVLLPIEVKVIKFKSYGIQKPRSVVLSREPCLMW